MSCKLVIQLNTPFITIHVTFFCGFACKTLFCVTQQCIYVLPVKKVCTNIWLLFSIHGYPIRTLNSSLSLFILSLSVSFPSLELCIVCIMSLTWTSESCLHSHVLILVYCRSSKEKVCIVFYFVDQLFSSYLTLWLNIFR